MDLGIEINLNEVLNVYLKRNPKPIRFEHFFLQIPKELELTKTTRQ